MSEYVTASFWKRTVERAVKTAAQTAVAFLGADAFDFIDLNDWQELGSVVGMAAVLSILTSLASARVGDPEDPSLV